jgi:ADP-ribose pyrophosphatase
VSGAPGEGSEFRILDDTTVWIGKRIHAGNVRVAAPDGSILEREVVHHPGAVGVVPLHDDGTVTLVRQYRVAIDAEAWEIPAGLRDVEGEPPDETARRELIEEAGLRPGHLEFLVSFHNSPGFTDERVDIYLATDLLPVPDDRQGVEEAHMAVERISLPSALAMIDDGRITDAKTVIALLLTARRA